MDHISCSSLTASSSGLLENTYSDNRSSVFSPFLLLPDSYASTSGARQNAYRETSSERRARQEFLHKAEAKEAMKKEDRISSWVQTQVENSAFIVMASAAQNEKKRYKRRSSSRQHRSEPRIAGQRSGSPLRFSYIPYTEEECEEQDVQNYCIPLSKSTNPLSYPPTPDHSCLPSSISTSPSIPKRQRTRSRRQRSRRLASSTSSLDSIPEE